MSTVNVVELNVRIRNPSVCEEYFRRAQESVDDNTGFNLILPDDILLCPGEIRDIDLGVCCTPSFEGPYHLLPRPLMERSPLRLLGPDNQVTDTVVLDSTYRDTLTVKVKNTDTRIFEIWRGERYFQICHPSKCALHTCIHS